MSLKPAVFPSEPIFDRASYADRYRILCDRLVKERLYDAAWFVLSDRDDATDVRAARSLIDRYHDQKIGLADASIAVLAHAYRTTRVLTLDHRRFEVLRTVAGRRLTLVPVRN